MKTVKLAEILEYYDGILLFTAQDPIGGNYLCEAIDTVGDFDRYAVVGVRPERLEDFRAGRVDLRTLMLEAPEDEWYITIADGTTDDPLKLEAQDGPLAETEYLPGEGYFWGPKEQPDHDGDVARALECGRVVTITGVLERADSGTGEWALLTDDGIEPGRTHPEGPGLNGLRIGGRYCFKCARVVRSDFLGQEKQTQYLHHIEQV